MTRRIFTAGSGLNEFDLIKEQRCTLLEIDDTIIKEFSREQIISVLTLKLFEQLLFKVRTQCAEFVICDS